MSDAKTHETKEERQNRGYDEVVDGTPPVKLDIMDTVAEPKTADERRIDRAAGDAANDVRRQEHSAD
ncbi:MAG TPA: hypothetical protein VFA27_04625 [Vicinamibacterales bacterium]|nr:hypothetical protein [Vicinamibacterales bacterium]